ncbi:hypothetical protein [Mucilaginibacter jinjuensis]|uniref:Uncharacterized protein n=1 Tax=Mucilaginibacter jinjuensis TaxID=1176721 RepID=A0ABY7T5Q1_9SPHI|nr:hypothetical protein [Mucilaginibacter jinjuensis]WCT11789.1 hypothetical protein PQO05_23955 [Mucilaginibacter jinjuensis]
MNNLKLILRYLLYIVSIPLIVMGSFDLFVNHPEVQLAFWVPGLVLIAYSFIRDDLYQRLRLVKGR